MPIILCGRLKKMNENEIWIDQKKMTTTAKFKIAIVALI